MMLHKKVEKMWRGKFVSVRDYEIPQAIQEGGMILHFGADRMIVSCDELQRCLDVCGSRVHKSRTGGRDYRLVDIPWRPSAQQALDLGFE